MFKQARDSYVPAKSYLTAKNELELNLIEIVKTQATAVAGPAVDDFEDVAEEVPTSPVKSSEVPSPEKIGVTASAIKEPELKDEEEVEVDEIELEKAVDEISIQDFKADEETAPAPAASTEKNEEDFLSEEENDW